ncbi:ABC transporter substrate binding protein [Castellaniella sp.]|uniref:ABC transporter substrate binding protein n=1 Tax=Castellaniella sp. TaxID=1955812 RepID=UPI00355DCE88
MIGRTLIALLMAVSLFSGLAPTAQAADAAPPVAATPSAAAPRLYPTTPVRKPDGSPWRIGYLESGEYAEYPRTLRVIVQGLQRLGWLALDDDIPTDMNGKALWLWLGEHAKGDDLTFVADAWWQPGDFDAAQREPTRDAIAQRIATRGDIDLILAMGTWAGQDMRAIGPPVPTVVGSTSNPIAAGIIDSVEDSGRDNLHARVEPQRYQRQLRLFHDIVPFQTLGIVYEDSPAGRTYAALDAVEQVSKELGFRIIPCHAVSSSVPTATAITNATGCYADLANQGVDAVYVTTHRGVTKESIHAIADILNKARIPTFSMAGSEEVAAGLLLSLAKADMSYVGQFHAETVARILNGASPRRLIQLWVDPPKIALNLGTARKIGFNPPVDILLAADEVYESPAWQQGNR